MNSILFVLKCKTKTYVLLRVKSLTFTYFGLINERLVYYHSRKLPIVLFNKKTTIIQVKNIIKKLCFKLKELFKKKHKKINCKIINY